MKKELVKKVSIGAGVVLVGCWFVPKVIAVASVAVVGLLGYGAYKYVVK